jgi:hypothetical protein
MSVGGALACMSIDHAMNGCNAVLAGKYQHESSTDTECLCADALGPSWWRDGSNFAGPAPQITNCETQCSFDLTHG